MEDKKIKAMIVEDDPDFCFLIKQTLYTAGIDIVGTRVRRGRGGQSRR